MVAPHSLGAQVVSPHSLGTQVDNQHMYPYPNPIMVFLISSGHRVNYLWKFIFFILIFWKFFFSLKTDMFGT